MRKMRRQAIKKESNTTYRQGYILLTGRQYIHRIYTWYNAGVFPNRERTTVERNAVELGLLSDMMVAEALYNTPNVTLCFDASTQEGVHFNTLHITTESILLDVEQLAGGKAMDYA